MRLTKTIPIEAERLTAELMADMALGETITVHCDTLCDKDNTRQNAYWVRSNKPRLDGHTYAISTSNINSTVTVTVVEANT